MCQMEAPLSPFTDERAGPVQGHTAGRGVMPGHKQMNETHGLCPQEAGHPVGEGCIQPLTRNKNTHQAVGPEEAARSIQHRAWPNRGPVETQEHFQFGCRELGKVSQSRRTQHTVQRFARAGPWHTVTYAS